MKYDLSGGISRSAGRVFSAFRGALFSLLQRQSFESISVQTLCNEADYPRSTFYNYFDDIYDLLDFCLHAPILGFDAQKYAVIRPEVRIFAVFNDLYDIVAERRDAMARVFSVNSQNGVLQNSLSKRLMQEVYEILKDAAPTTGTPLPRELLAEHCCNVIHLLFAWCFFRPETLSREAALEALQAMVGGLFRGAAPTGGAT